MAAIKKIQTAFTAGEISPRLLARTDLEAYDKSVKTMENAYVFSHGGCRRRPGSRFIMEMDDPEKEIRMIPFIASETDSFVLTFHNGKIYFMTESGPLLSGGNPYTLAHPFGEDLERIGYAQAGNVMFLTHPDYPPKIFQRITNTNWTLTDIAFTYNAKVDAWYNSAYLEFKLIKYGDGFAAGDSFAITTNGAGLVSGIVFTGSGTGDVVEVSIDADNDAAGRVWTLTCLYATENDQVFAVSGTGIGSPTATWTADDYPRGIAFFNQRLFLGGTETRPQDIWSSAVGNYTDLTPGTNDSDGFHVIIASNRFDKIFHLESARQLIPLTYGGEFTMTGGAVGLTPSAVQIKAQTSHGTTNVKPIRVEYEVLFIQRDGKKVRAMSYDVQLDVNTAPDLTILSEHITGDGLVDGTYQQDPDSIVWFAREDGQGVTLTHLIEQNVTAWARHVTDGQFKTMCAIPERSTDVVYLGVRRYIDGAWHLMIENFEDGLNTDCALTGTSGTPQDTWSGLDHLEGKEVAIVADGKVHPVETVDGGSVTLNYTASEVEIGLAYCTQVELHHPEVAMGDGTAQGRQLRIAECVLRVQDTIGMEVDGETVPVMSFNDHFDTPPTLYTGDIDRFTQGWASPRTMMIQQKLPMPFTLLGVILKIDVGDR